MAFVPRHSQLEDLRYAAIPDPRKVAFQRRTAPPVLRLDVVAAEKGRSYLLENERGSARYRAGDGYGGVIYMPPHYDVDYIESGLALPTTSKQHTLALWDVQLGFGRLGRRGDTSGLPVESYVTRRVSGELVTSYFDASAVALEAMVVATDGCVRFSQCVGLDTFYEIKSEGLAAGFSLLESASSTELLNITGSLANLSSITGGLLPPEGTTAQRSGGPGNWETRSNSTTGALEAFDPSGAGTWRDFAFSGAGGTDGAKIYSFETYSVATGTTTVPDDDTIPLRTEGDRYLVVQDVVLPVGTTKAEVSVNVMASHSASTTYLVGFITRIAQPLLASAGRTFTITGGASGYITGSSGDFIADGYQVGMHLTIGGTTSNNGTYTIAAVTATRITTSATLTSEGPLSSTMTLAGETDAVAAMGSSAGAANNPVVFRVELEDTTMAGASVDITQTWAFRLGGGNAGTTTVNGTAGSRRYGDIPKSRMTVRVIST
jgi:hypothetical protein